MTPAEHKAAHAARIAAMAQFAAENPCPQVPGLSLRKPVRDDRGNVYDSIGEAAKANGCSKAAITHGLKYGRRVKGVLFMRVRSQQLAAEGKA